jgi:hypothetical protein
MYMNRILVYVYLIIYSTQSEPAGDPLFLRESGMVHFTCALYLYFVHYVLERIKNLKHSYFNLFQLPYDSTL